MYNFASQRRNMTNHCPNTSADPGNRNAWGVDLNRNYRFASGFDGYDGASTSCTSDTFQGPSKLSEPESKNIIWLAESFPNVKFMMSVHSNGGQLFWQPGAYIANGRIVAPRPPLGHEAFYWQSASRILSQVKAERQTVVTPENVGGSADVLYSSAGNVREDLYNNHGVFAFGWEVGGSVYNTATGNFVDGSFQPAWVGNPDIVSGHSETMEYANGVMEMFRIAAEWGKDRVRPKTQLVPGRGKYSGPVDVHFETSEPADIYYTTDGTVPSLQSARYKATEFREPGQTFHVTETTVFKWFSVDTAGNFERGFDPDDPGAELPERGDQDPRLTPCEGRGACRRPAPSCPALPLLTCRGDEAGRTRLRGPRCSSCRRPCPRGRPSSRARACSRSRRRPRSGTTRFRPLCAPYVSSARQTGSRWTRPRMPRRSPTPGWRATTR